MGLRQSKETVSIPEYAFLDDPNTVDYVRKSRVLLILQGCPEVCKRVDEVYPDHAKVFSGSQSDILLNEVENYLKLASPDSPELVVVDDPELQSLEQVNPFGSLAIKFNLVQVSPAVGEEFVPLFYGWFFNLHDSRDTLRQQATELLKEIGKEEKFVEEFTKSAIDNDKPPDDFDIQKYYHTDTLTTGEILLHCTAFFTNFKPTDLTKEYFQKNSKSISKAFNLEAIGFLITPRTFGVRLKLNDEDLVLWQEDPSQQAGSEVGWKPSQYSPTYGPGSRAHLTMAVRESTPAVQTGLDLEEIIRREVHDQKDGRDRLTIQLTNGVARCYDEGLWAVYLNKRHRFKALFSNFYFKSS